MPYEISAYNTPIEEYVARLKDYVIPNDYSTVALFTGDSTIVHTAFNSFGFIVKQFANIAPYRSQCQIDYVNDYAVVQKKGLNRRSAISCSVNQTTGEKCMLFLLATSPLTESIALE